MINFWEVVDRAINTGPLMKQKEFDLKIFKVSSRLVKKYEIKYNAKIPVPSDDDLADRVFEAGVELYREVGTYCIDTERVMLFTEDEIFQAISEANQLPDYIEVGAGTDKRRMYKRRIGDSRRPGAMAGVIESNPIEGRDFVQLYKSIAQETIFDGIYYGPTPKSIEGKSWLLGSPLEGYAARSAVGWTREALRSVGRPGLHLIDGTPSAYGAISACDPENGLRKTDCMSFPAICELKTNFEVLNKVAYGLNYGCFMNAFWTPVVGGFAGGPEGCALVCIANACNAILVYQIAGRGYVGSTPMMQIPSINTGRESIWTRNVAMQAIARNINLMPGGGAITAAGPGTEQQLWEIAALAIAQGCVGGHMLHGARKGVLVKPNQGSGLEPKWYAEAGQAGAALTRQQASDLLNYIFNKYENNVGLDQAPEGFSFSELYDYNTLKIKTFYQEIYLKVKEELQKKGLVFTLR